MGFRLPSKISGFSDEINRLAGGDFPLNARLAKYALSLLNLMGRNSSKLVDLIFVILTENQIHSICDNFQNIGENAEELDELREALLDADDIGDLSRAFSRFFSNPKKQKERRLFLQESNRWLEQHLIPDKKSYIRRTEQLCSKLRLGHDEIAVLEFGCCYQICAELENLFDSINITKQAGVIAHAIGLSPVAVRKIVASGSALSEIEMITMDERRFSIDDSIFNYLIGHAGNEFATEAFTLASVSGIPLRLFDLNPDQQTLLVNLLNAPEPANILFYGKPGTGKTELSKALAAKCGKKAVFVSYGNDGECRDRKLALTATVNSVSEETIVVVDEIDGLINTQNSFRDARINKGWINHFLDINRHKLVWIANNVDGVEECVRRRFDFSLNFKQLNARQREAIWLDHLRKKRIKRFFDIDAIKHLARHYPTSPGLISYAVSTVSRCVSSDVSGQELLTLVEEILCRQLELTEGLVKEKKLQDKTSKYDPNALNTDFCPATLLNLLEKYRESGDESGVNLLFWGQPGTGKTEFAKHIADQLGMELLVKRASDLLGMYLGQTEKQIAMAFREAEQNDAILFLDEADSLVINRQNSSYRWENSQTNEILTQMENFSGILICCTNLLEHLDEAAMRRFPHKVKFLPLTNDGKIRLYCQYFKDIAEPHPEDMGRLLSRIHNLCPGDIKAVWQRVKYNDSMTHAEIIGELEREVSYKHSNHKAPIGFC